MLRHSEPRRLVEGADAGAQPTVVGNKILFALRPRTPPPPPPPPPEEEEAGEGEVEGERRGESGEAPVDFGALGGGESMVLVGPGESMILAQLGEGSLAEASLGAEPTDERQR